MSTPILGKGWLLCILLFGIQNIFAFPTPEVSTTVKDSLIQIDSIVFQARFLRKNIIQKEFNQGDRIAISFHEASGIGLSCIKVISPSNYVDTIFDGPDKFDKIEFPIREQGTYTFQFVNRKVVLQWPLGLRKDCRFVLWHVNWVRSLSEFVAFDTVRSDTFNQIKVLKDTAILPILNEKVYIQPKRNLIDPPRAVLEMVLPKEVKKWGFWLGVGEAASRQYAQWEAGLSDENILSPLHAYIEGVIPKLPVNESGNSVSYDFTDYEGQKEFMSNGTINHSFISADEVKADFGKREVNQETEEGNEQKMFICLENSHPNSGINVDVKVLASAVIYKRDTVRTDSITRIKPRIFFTFEDTSKSAVQKELIAFHAGLEAARKKLIKDFRSNPNPDTSAFRIQMEQFDDIQSLLDTIAYQYNIIPFYLGAIQNTALGPDIPRIKEIAQESKDVKDSTDKQDEPDFVVKKPRNGAPPLTVMVDDTLTILDSSLYIASGPYADSLKREVIDFEDNSANLNAIIQELNKIQESITNLTNKVESLLEKEDKADIAAAQKISDQIELNLVELQKLEAALSEDHRNHAVKDIIQQLAQRLKKLDRDLTKYIKER